ncbi:hypothetical protein PR003_g29769 [Phytophthora rubi]|uniref:Uncharacterized protein n=1 Tax=Phytophthora rubi TaxID=129364 RepID=A0A6A4BIP1_9STRA|nr:hypothetical protein PR003_g29769 [Phytophthora rubi]
MKSKGRARKKPRSQDVQEKEEAQESSCDVMFQRKKSKSQAVT